MIIVKQHINKFKITVIIMSIIDDAIEMLLIMLKRYLKMIIADMMSFIL